METAVRNIRINRIKVKVCRRIGVWSGYISFIWLYYEDEHFTDWGMLSLPNIIKQKAYKSFFQAMLIGNTKWEQDCPSQCRVEQRLER